ncbi:NucA/NucB deoxyribonuclease domain-containing protein [Streptosporangium canum]|uniref:NucA/NucB deoxyribonuclease domain-containing protein n=1 Tax=Streptosporangium canum TaxID=324952 RepID=UPI003F4DE689
MECDEYPFASTYQGAAGPTGKGHGHYSVRAVNGKHNGDHGDALKRFYDAHHVASSHPFCVSIAN